MELLINRLMYPLFQNLNYWRGLHS